MTLSDLVRATLVERLNANTADRTLGRIEKDGQKLRQALAEYDAAIEKGQDLSMRANRQAKGQR